MCGLNPKLGSDFWAYIAQKNIIHLTDEVKDSFYRYGFSLKSTPIQNLILKTIKEARDCCGHQGQQVYYCIPHVSIDSFTSNEDVSLLCDMIIKNKSTNLKSIKVERAFSVVEDICLSNSRYQSLFGSISCATNLTVLTLNSISCQTTISNDSLPLVDLHNHHRLRLLKFDRITKGDLRLPSQDKSQLQELDLYSLNMSHGNLVQLCESLLSLSNLEKLRLTKLSCIDHSRNCRLPLLDLQNHKNLEKLEIDNISISGLLLPGQEESNLNKVELSNMLLSRDSLVTLYSSLSSWSSLIWLTLTNLFCNNYDGSCCPSVLDLHRHHKLEWLKLESISISRLFLSSQEESKLDNLTLNNMLLSHDSLVQICKLLSSSSALKRLNLTNVPCSDHGRSCSLPLLDLRKHSKLLGLVLDKLSISGLLFPIPDESRFKYLELYNLVLQHDTLVQLCSSISSFYAFERLKLANLLCNDHSGRCGVPILDLPKVELEYVDVEHIPVEHLQTLPGLEDVQLPIMPHGKESGLCKFNVLNLQKYHSLKVLNVETSSISGMILPRQGRHRMEITDLDLKDLVLSHYSLEELCKAPAYMPFLDKLLLTNLSCSDHCDLCRLPALDLRIHIGFGLLKLDRISICGLLLPCMQQPKTKILWKDLELKELTLSHDSLVQLCSLLPSVNAKRLNNLSCSDHRGSCILSAQGLSQAELQLPGLSSDPSDEIIGSDHSDRWDLTDSDLQFLGFASDSQNETIDSDKIDSDKL